MSWAFPVWSNKRLLAFWPYRPHASHFFQHLCFQRFYFLQIFYVGQTLTSWISGLNKTSHSNRSINQPFSEIICNMWHLSFQKTQADCSTLWTMYCTLSTLHSSEGTVRLTEWIVKTWQDRTIGNDTVRAHGQWAKTPDCDLGTE